MCLECFKGMLIKLCVEMPGDQLHLWAALQLSHFPESCCSNMVIAQISVQFRWNSWPWQIGECGEELVTWAQHGVLRDLCGSRVKLQYPLCMSHIGLYFYEQKLEQLCCSRLVWMQLQTEFVAGGSYFQCFNLDLITLNGLLQGLHARSCLQRQAPQLEDAESSSRLVLSRDQMLAEQSAFPPSSCFFTSL